MSDSVSRRPTLAAPPHHKYLKIFEISVSTWWRSDFGNCVKLNIILTKDNLNPFWMGRKRIVLILNTFGASKAQKRG
jgi:hypothetical protein